MATETHTLVEQHDDEIGDLRGAVDVLNEAHTQNDITNAPNTPSSGIITHSSAGQQKYASSDGGVYNTGRATIYKTSAQTISTTGASAVTFDQGSNTLPVGIGAYRIKIYGSYLENAAAGTPSLEVTGPATSTVEILSQVYPAAAGAGSVLTNRMTALGAGGAFTSNTMTSTTRIFNIEGLVVFTATGSVGFSAFTSAGADTFNIQAGTFMELMPVS